jgi:integrase
MPAVMKGGVRSYIPLTTEAMHLFQAIRDDIDHAGRVAVGKVFPFSERDVKRASRLLKKFASGLGLEINHHHALRHLFASVAMEQGFSAKEVAELLGHRDGGVLAMRTYGHIRPAVLRDKVRTLSICEAVPLREGV